MGPGVQGLHPWLANVTLSGSFECLLPTLHILCALCAKSIPLWAHLKGFPRDLKNPSIKKCQNKTFIICPQL